MTAPATDPPGTRPDPANARPAAADARPAAPSRAGSVTTAPPLSAGGAGRRWLVLAVALAAVYLTVAGHPESWLSGLPLTPLALGVAAIGGVLLWALWPPRGDRAVRLWRPAAVLVGLLVLARAVVGSQALVEGLPGWYYDNSRFQGEPERSTEFRGEPWTRRDREIFFGGDELPVFFLNDVQRFNFFGAEAERRRNIPFSVRWDGYLYVPASGTYQLWLTASGPAALRVDGRQVAVVDADGRATEMARLELAAGSHPIRVTYARRPPRSPDLKVEWNLDGRRQPLAVPFVFGSPVEPVAWQQDRTLLAVSRGLDVAFLALAGAAVLALLAVRLAEVRRDPGRRWHTAERAVLAGWLIAVFLYASVPHLDRVGKVELLGGGQDWLTHETFARDILIAGPLMTLGKPLGEGRTFYAQPFYPYALAGLHALTGEDLFGVVALQMFGSAVAGVLVYFLARRVFGVPAAVVAFGLFLPLWWWHLEWVSRRLISEAVYFVILPALLLVLVRCLDERRPRDFLLAGLLLGLAIVTRGPTLLYVPLAGMILWLGLARAGLPSRVIVARLALLADVALPIVGLVPLRNGIVAGQPALLASSGGVNLQKLHRPTPQVRLNRADERWFAPYVRNDAPTRETVEFLLQDPVGYAASSALLAAYALGYGAAVEESQVTAWPELIALNVLYLLGLLLLVSVRSLRATLLHAFVLIHFFTMVVFVPYDYDNRLVLPMYLPILVVAAHVLADAGRRLVSRLRGRVPVRALVAGPPAT